jgi:1-aminocyclopropane-1-carboxylate deaminase/D-cysteine desulfhydrase-like pyridoxal-dependent ACC family enzyme
MLGYVDAAFELVDQCAAVQESMPDTIYVPCGSHGTAAGLAYGLALAGAHTQVEAIAVDDEVTDETMSHALHDLKHFIDSLDEQLNTVEVKDIQVCVRREFYGDGYAVPLESTPYIQGIFLQHQIVLDSTYTAKAAAALVQDALDEKLKDKKVLFWLTLDSDVYPIDGEESLKKMIPDQFKKYIG